jgi:tetratricopeptide (TPR) repeat protein
MSDYKKALEYHEKSLKICVKLLGEGHVDTATNYNNMGNVYDSLSDYTKALEYYEKSLNI